MTYIMTFDPEYFNRIYAFINEADNRQFEISDLTEEPDKFVFHLKYYIETRQADDLCVVFNSLSESEQMYGVSELSDADKYSHFKILEFFEGKHFEKRRQQNINKMWDKDKKNQSPFGPARQTSTTDQHVSVKVEAKNDNVSKQAGLFQ